MSEDTTTFGPWIEGLKSDDDATFEAAVRALWGRLALQTKAYARKKLCSFPRRAFNESDVANSGFNSFCQGVREDRFSKLDNKDDLWKVLGRIVARKARAYIRAEKAIKRGGGQVRGDSALAPLSDSAQLGGFDAIKGPKVNPHSDLEFDDLLTALRRHDPVLPDVALLLLAGMENKEIADTLNIAVRSVERKRQLIRQLWASYCED